MKDRTTLRSARSHRIWSCWTGALPGADPPSSVFVVHFFFGVQLELVGGVHLFSLLGRNKKRLWTFSSGCCRVELSIAVVKLRSVNHRE